MKTTEAKIVTPNHNPGSSNEFFFNGRPHKAFFSNSHVDQQQFFNNNDLGDGLSSEMLQTKPLIGDVENSFKVNASKPQPASPLATNEAQSTGSNALAVQTKCSECAESEFHPEREESEADIHRKPEIETEVFDDRAHSLTSFNFNDGTAMDTTSYPTTSVNEIVTTPTVQANCAECDKQEKEENLPQEPKVRKKAIFDSANDPPEEDGVGIQRQSDSNQTTSESSYSGTEIMQDRIERSKGQGSPLEDPIKSQMESAFASDFTDVNIHTDSTAVGLNHDLHAQAFAYGSDLYFNQDKYKPQTTSGQHLLAHELTHVLQQRGTERNSKIQRYSWDEFVEDARTTVESSEDTLDEAGQFVGETVEEVENVVIETGQAFGDKLSAAGEAAEEVASSIQESVTRTTNTVYRAGEDVFETGVKVIEIAVDTTSDTLNWLGSEAGQMAKNLASSLGGVISVSSAGIVIRIPKVCPLPAMPMSLDLPKIKKEYMVPVVALPIGPDLFITGEIGLTGNIEPKLELQAGPFCLNGVQVEINPFTDHYSVSGSISATVAAALGAEMRGGVKGELSLSAIIPIGGVPVPVSVPVIGIEGGLSGIIMGIGANTFTLGGSLAYSRGSITGNGSGTLDIGLGAALFLGAYGQMDILGENLCRIYWQPWSWFGGIGASLNMSASLIITPGALPVLTPIIGTPSLQKIPFDQFPLVIGKKGFTDDCPLIDKTCEVLKTLRLLPSQNGGTWDWTATGHSGTYGPGPRLQGSLDVYEKNPAIPSGAECRGACGVNCNTCTPKPQCRYIDPTTGEIWEYINFQDCNSNDGCRQHDAAFDWAADKKGEIGKWAIVMPWHMAANIECGCNNLAGNCLAWIAGLPPYDKKMYFAENAKQLAGSGNNAFVQHSSDPIGEWGPDFYHYSKTAPSSNLPAGEERWTDYHTNCRAEAQAATGVPDDLNYVTILSDDDADAYIDRDNFNTRWFTSIIYGNLVAANHYINFCEIPPYHYTTTALDIFTPDCSGITSANGGEEAELEQCDREELPPDYCEELYNRVIEKFGDRDRNLDLNPDEDVDETRTRVDDAPILSSFRTMYNRLDSWKVFIQHRHPELYSKFNTRFEVSRKKIDWIKELKERVANYKNKFRDVRRQDVESLKREFITRDLEEFKKRIDSLNRDIAAWYKANTRINEDLDTIIERVHKEGTELWREAWRAAILAVNRILSRLWPPAKGRIQNWVKERKREHPSEDLEGQVNDIDYIGSLAMGYKGAPKQFIRFNPDKFDVDANLKAPPLAKFAMNIRGIDPDRGRIFAIGDNTTIMPLIIFCQDTHRELSGVQGYDTSDPFDVVIIAHDRPEQERSRVGSEKLYQLRNELNQDRYSQLIQKVRSAGLLTPEAGGWRLKQKLTEEESIRLSEVLCQYGI